MTASTKVEISHRTIIFTALFLLLLWFLYNIRDIIFIFFIALLIMAVFNPMVTKLSKAKVPRLISVLVVYLAAFALIAIMIAGIAPPLVDQSSRFANGLPNYLARGGVSSVISEQVIGGLIVQIGDLSGQIVKFGISIFSNLLAVITVLIFAFYLLLARDKLDDQLTSLFGDKKNKEIGRMIDLLEFKLGGWARGQVTLMILVGLSTFIGLTLLGIPFSLPLAILAGLLEIIPNIGPVLAAIPAVIIGFGISPVIGFATLALVFLIQQVENYVLVPKVMQKSVGVNPIITLLALAIGFKLAGVIGMAISIPVFITIQVIVKEYFSPNKNPQKTPT